MADFMEFELPDSTEFKEEILRDYLDQRIIIINDEIGDRIIESAVLYILKWNREDKGLPKECRVPIKVYINTLGGSLFSGNALVEAILASKTKVIGVALGLVASMGYQIYLACDERVGFSNSVLLMHDGEINVQNSSSKAKQTMNFFDDLETRTKEFVLSRTIMSEEFYDRVYDQEYWMLASEKGKELGVVHKIIGIDCDLDEIL